jgi:nucleoid-associated protein YgaU
MDTVAPVVAPDLSAEPAQGVDAEASAEPMQETEPAVVVSAGEESPPLSEHRVPEAREADAVVPTETEEAFFLYTVQQGDTLGSIAVEQLCRFWAWRNIYAQNRELIGEPKKLAVGIVLRIDRRDSRCPPGSTELQFGIQ